MALDPRHSHPVRLTPPAPLPYVSRRALRRVKDPLPPPVHCPYCDGPVALVNNATIYGREYGAWPFAYLCMACDAYVGLHPDTDLPLGTLANAELRCARKAGKAEFHSMIKTLQVGRSWAYAWLAKEMGIQQSACHWGMFDIPSCILAASICRARVRAYMYPTKRVEE